MALIAEQHAIIQALEDLGQQGLRLLTRRLHRHEDLLRLRGSFHRRRCDSSKQIRPS